MIKKLGWSVFLIFVLNQNGFAQLPDFTELVKTNGVAVVNISTTQKPKPELPDAQKQPPLPEGLPPEMEITSAPWRTRTSQKTCPKFSTPTTPQRWAVSSGSSSSISSSQPRCKTCSTALPSRAQQLTIFLKRLPSNSTTHTRQSRLPS